MLLIKVGLINDKDVVLYETPQNMDSMVVQLTSVCRGQPRFQNTVWILFVSLYLHLNAKKTDTAEAGDSATSDTRH